MLWDVKTCRQEIDVLPCRYTGLHHSSYLARSRPSPHHSWHSSHQHRGRWRPGAEGEYCCRTQAAKGWSSQASPTRSPLGRVLRRPSTIPWSRIQATTDGLLYCIWMAVFSRAGRECNAQIYANSVYWQLLILAARRSVTGCVMNSSVCVCVVWFNGNRYPSTSLSLQAVRLLCELWQLLKTPANDYQWLRISRRLKQGDEWSAIT